MAGGNLHGATDGPRGTICGAMDGPRGLSVAAVHGPWGPLIGGTIRSMTGSSAYALTQRVKGHWKGSCI